MTAQRLDSRWWMLTAVVALGCGAAPPTAQIPAAPEQDVPRCIATATTAIEAAEEQAWVDAEAERCGQDRSCVQACADGDAAACTAVSKTFGQVGDMACAKTLREHACSNGDTEGCAWLARLLRFGDGVPRDEARAAELARTACDDDNGVGCWLLGDLEDDPKRAAKLLATACSLEASQGCVGLARVKLEGDGVRRDAEGAAKLLDRACGLGDPVGCTWLGELHAQGVGVSEDQSVALLLFEQGCRGGAGWGCRLAGACHLRGCSGTDPSPVLAQARFRRGCHLADGPSCGIAAARAIDDRDGEAYYQTAVELASRGCKLGSPLACMVLADAHLLGKGLPVNPARAQRLYRRMCLEGEVMACGPLVWSAHERGLAMGDAPVAIAAIRSSCEQDGEACRWLLVFERYGIGMPAEPARARQRAAGLCEAGDSDGCHQLLAFAMEEAHFADAQAAIDQGLKHDESDQWLTWMQGVLDAVRDRPRAALRVLKPQREHRDSRVERPLVELWIHHVSARLGRRPDAQLRDAMELHGGWPAPIAAHRLGLIDEQELLARADAAPRADQRRARRCQAYFFLGLQAYERHQRAVAIRWLRRAVKTRQYFQAEDAAAMALLQRLGAAEQTGRLAAMEVSP